jgi:multidrug resistance efflux pump
MIVFLTLLYVGVLAVLVKLNVVRLTLWWKLSPLVWMLVLLVVLFIPLQWGAPVGSVNVYQPVIEIVPNVSGEVVEVPSTGSRPLEEGDVLFRIDPEPYQAEVDRLKAALKEAEQAAKMLPSDVASAEAAVAQAEASLVEAKQREQSLAAEVEAAAAAVAKATADANLARATYTRESTLAQKSPDAVTQQRLDVLRAEVTAADAALKVAQAQEKQARLAFESQIEGVNTAVAKAEEDRKAALAAEQKAELALESTINGENTAVAQLRSQLVRADYDLTQTTVTAPSAGFVAGLTLRPGQRVAAFPMRSWMAFVDTEHTTLAVGVQQYALRHVKPGQKAEVALKLFPGQTFSATVEKIAYITPEGQLQPTGNVVLAPTRGGKPLPYAVVLELDDPGIQIGQLPGGGTGTAAIYTDSARATHIIRRVMIRMESYMNFVIPW